MVPGMLGSGQETLLNKQEVKKRKAYVSAYWLCLWRTCGLCLLSDSSSHNRHIWQLCRYPARTRAEANIASFASTGPEGSKGSCAVGEVPRVSFLTA